MPRVPGDGAYAPNDDDVEAQATKICITPAPKLKPFQFESVVVESCNNMNGNTLSPSIIKHGATLTVDPVDTNHLSPSSCGGGGSADEDDGPNGREGECYNTPTTVTIYYLCLLWPSTIRTKCVIKHFTHN